MENSVPFCEHRVHSGPQKDVCTARFLASTALMPPVPQISFRKPQPKSNSHSAAQVHTINNMPFRKGGENTAAKSAA